MNTVKHSQLVLVSRRCLIKWWKERITNCSWLINGRVLRTASWALLTRAAATSLMASVILLVFLMLLMRSLRSRVLPSMTIVDPLTDTLEATFVGENACTLLSSTAQQITKQLKEAAISKSFWVTEYFQSNLLFLVRLAMFDEGMATGSGILEGRRCNPKENLPFSMPSNNNSLQGFLNGTASCAQCTT